MQYEAPLHVEITLPDGTRAVWFRESDVSDYTIDALTNAVESLLGTADQVDC